VWCVLKGRDRVVEERFLSGSVEGHMGVCSRFSQRRAV
jgi:hypothetical protein